MFTITKSGLKYDLNVVPSKAVGVENARWSMLKLILRVEIEDQDTPWSKKKRYFYVTLLKIHQDLNGDRKFIKPDIDRECTYNNFAKMLKDRYHASILVPKESIITDSDIEKYKDSVIDVLDNLHKFVKY